MTVIVFFFLGCLGCVFLCGIKIHNYIKRLNNKIVALTNQLNEITQRNEFIKHCGNGYDYLAIGNSITLHSECNFWWNECGMAATTKDNDYFHIVLRGLCKKHESINSQAFCFYLWETQYTDRAETLLLLKDYLHEELDLITVQLGENAQDITTFESDFQYLLHYIKDKSPKAQIIVIGDFWEYSNRDEIKQDVCQKNNIEYIDLNQIKDKADYCCGLGTLVYDKDGNTHKGACEKISVN